MLVLGIRLSAQSATTSLCLGLLSGIVLANSSVAVEAPSGNIGLLKDAVTGSCLVRTATFYANGYNDTQTYKVTRKLINKDLKGQQVHAFEYRYSQSGNTPSNKLPKPRYDYLIQEPNGTIRTLAHEYNLDANKANKNSIIEYHNLVFLPSKLHLGLSWVGDTATISDVDKMNVKVTGIESIDDTPTWVITQTKPNKDPSPTRGITEMQVVYNLEPKTLSTLWVFSSGKGIVPAHSKYQGLAYDFMYQAACNTER